MSLPRIHPVTTNSWKKLQQHFEQIEGQSMFDWFHDYPERAEEFSLCWDDFYLDYSKNRITSETLSLLIELAKEVKLDEAISALFSAEKINETENKAVQHTALRDFDAMPDGVAKTLKRIKEFSEAVIEGEWKGVNGKQITDIVNIGIGGSDLGPQMVCDALKFYKSGLNMHFVSNVDGDYVMDTLRELKRDQTLFIVVSKSFRTQETLRNARTIREWFLGTMPESAMSNHFVAVSANKEAVVEFGIKDENIFPMWEWVGGRFSLWGAAGLSIACSVGYHNFEQLLKGAFAMDRHFRSEEFSQNMPVLLGLLSVWYNNFFNCESECIVPYSEYLKKLVPYLQQASMESNGKRTDRNGDVLNYDSGAIVWGSTGTNAQHAFFQLLHQGTKLVPADFICYKQSLHGNTEHQQILLANCFAQSEALLRGTKDSKVENSYQQFEGNKPSNTLLIDKLTPKSLGSLIAMYEHKIFVQGVIWNIYSFDQWGVELGKKIAKSTLKAIKGQEPELVKNASTAALIKKLS